MPPAARAAIRDGRAADRPRLAVITGASSGIGLATAELLAARGWRLVLAARDADALQAVAERLRGTAAGVHVIATDVGNATAVQALAQAALGLGGAIDLWFANVGIGAVGRFEQVPVDAHEQVLRSNLIGHLYEAHAVLPIFLDQRHGIFVNMISMIGFTAAPLGAAYSASKFGLIGLSKSLRAELTAYPDIHICDVYPALVDTPALAHAANYTGKKIRPPTPMLDPRRVAAAVARLADHPRPTTLVGAQTWAARIGHALAPGLSLALIDRWFESYFAGAERVATTSGNLFQPPGDESRVDGGFRRPVRRRLPLLLAAGVVGAVGAAVLLRQRRVVGSDPSTAKEFPMTENPSHERKDDEQRTHAVDAQQPLPREGRVDALAGPQPDGIPMTGEEDPLVEVEQFSDAVRCFSASERGKDG